MRLLAIAEVGIYGRWSRWLSVCVLVWRVGVRRLVVYSSRKMIGEKKEQQQAADAIWLTVCAVAEDNFHCDW